MKKELEIGKDYGFALVGLDPKKGQHMIYNGGDSWTAKNGDKERTADSPGTTAKALEYINRPEYHVGNLR